MQVRKYLSLSTAHLQPHTCNGWLKQTDISCAEHRHGWWVWVPDERLLDYPADLVECFVVARRHDCSWINFDCDAPVEKSLTEYNW